MKKVRLLHYSFLLIVFLLLSHIGFAQRQITGIVQESIQNSPLQGAAVSVKGQKISTITADSICRFTVKSPANSKSRY